MAVTLKEAVMPWVSVRLCGCVVITGGLDCARAAGAVNSVSARVTTIASQSEPRPENRRDNGSVMAGNRVALQRPTAI